MKSKKYFLQKFSEIFYVKEFQENLLKLEHIFPNLEVILLRSKSLKLWKRSR